MLPRGWLLLPTLPVLLGALRLLLLGAYLSGLGVGGSALLLGLLFLLNFWLLRWLNRLPLLGVARVVSLRRGRLLDLLHLLRSRHLLRLHLLRLLHWPLMGVRIVHHGLHHLSRVHGDGGSGCPS